MLKSELIERFCRDMCIIDGLVPDADFRVRGNIVLSVAVEHPENWRMYEMRIRRALDTLAPAPSTP